MGVFVIRQGWEIARAAQSIARVLPEMEPMTFGSLYIWNHRRLFDGILQIHMDTVSAGRPSDFDRPAVVA
jgi:hypothetical protein